MSVEAEREKKVSVSSSLNWLMGNFLVIQGFQFFCINLQLLSYLMGTKRFPLYSMKVFLQIEIFYGNVEQKEVQ